jgi:hypothetical protein
MAAEQLLALNPQPTGFSQRAIGWQLALLGLPEDIDSGFQKISPLLRRNLPERTNPWPKRDV